MPQALRQPGAAEPKSAVVLIPRGLGPLRRGNPAPLSPRRLRRSHRGIQPRPHVAAPCQERGTPVSCPVPKRRGADKTC